jgi:acyl-CoA reductase-like NAD-dependent aldehyde dehydrogenase
VTQDYTYRLYIDGKWVDGTGGEPPLVVLNPATEEEIGVVPVGSVDDARAAIQSARNAFDQGPWSRSMPRDRAKVLGRMADIMRRRWCEIVALNVAEAGSTQALAQFLQVGAPIEAIRDYADRVLPSYQFDTPMMPYIGAGGAAGIGQGVVQREAIGVASLITAYNFPFFLNVFKLAPALAAGCTAVLKPSPDTPLEALIIGQIAEEAGLPPGVLNIVTGGIDASAELTHNPMVDIVSFTGSDIVGRAVYKQASDTLKRVVLELGGKSANIILSDADVEQVIPNILRNFLTHAGQGCSLLTRTLVHRSLIEEVTAGVVAALEHVKVGDPADPEVVMGPLISARQRARVEELVSIGVEEGGRVAYGGGRPEALDRGYFVEPTVFVDVDNSMTIARREIFGPVTAIIPFDTEDEAVEIANDSEYGLGGGVWSSDPVRAYEIARRMRTGSVTVNGGGGGGLNPWAPFGGYKLSGLGREWGTAGMEEFLQHKAITWPAGGC